MGESDLPGDLAAFFYSPRQPEELEEYTWVSQTSLYKGLLCSEAQGHQRSWRSHVSESDLPEDLAALVYSLRSAREEFKRVS
jgi:hypothetical protein